MSKKALKNGHAEHIHSNCDCTYAVRFDGKSGVAGYDPKKYEDMYYGADGDTPQDRINAIRRMKYQENKDRINAQKRAAYAERKEKIEQAKTGQVELLKKYGSVENIMITGSSEDMIKWSDLVKTSGLSEKDILEDISRDADNWEALLSKNTEKQMQVLTNMLLDEASDEELSALRMWTGETYVNINRYERYGIHVDEISRNAAHNIENILDRLEIPEDMIVRRGTGTKEIFEKMPKGWKEDPSLLVGRTFTDKGFTATSPIENGGFSGLGESQAELFIKVPKGTHGAYLNSVAHNPLEREMLLQKDYSYRIIKAEYRENPRPQFKGEYDLKVWVEVIKK